MCSKNRQVVGGAEGSSGHRVVYSLIHSSSTVFVEKLPRVAIGQGFFSFWLGILLLAKDFPSPQGMLAEGIFRISPKIFLHG